MNDMVRVEALIGPPTKGMLVAWKGDYALVRWNEARFSRWLGPETTLVHGSAIKVLETS